MARGIRCTSSMMASHNAALTTFSSSPLLRSRPSPPPAPGAEAAAEGASTLAGEARAAEIFEQFRSLMEDEF